MKWADVLPAGVATKQAVWEADAAMVRAYAAPGATLKSVGKAYGVGQERVRQRIARGLRRNRAPVEVYLDGGLGVGPVEALGLIKALAVGFRPQTLEERKQSAKEAAWEEMAEVWARERKEQLREAARVRAIQQQEENRRLAEEARKRREAYESIPNEERARIAASVRELERQVEASVAEMLPMFQKTQK